MKVRAAIVPLHLSSLPLTALLLQPLKAYIPREGLPCFVLSLVTVESCERHQPYQAS